MTTLEYEYHGYDEVEAAMRRLAFEYMATTDAATGKWTKEQRAGLKAYGYPSQTNKPQPFKTDRQRRWFFWALYSGLITVPYHRTGRLANSWRAERVGLAEWIVANSAEYSSLVIGQGQQAKYHEDNWWTAEAVLKPKTSALGALVVHDLMDLTKGMK